MRRLALLIALLAAAPAQAQQISATVSPEIVVYGRDSRVTWRITIRTQAQPASFRLHLSSASRSPEQHGALGFQPSRLISTEVRLEGPGTMSGGQSLVVDHCSAFTTPLPTYGHPSRHGFDPDGLAYEVHVPANSESTVVAPSEVSAHAPWPGTEYLLSARVGDMPLELPRAAAGGPAGVPLTITTDPPATGNICGERPRFAGRRAMRINGRTDPAIAGDRIDLVEVVPDGSRPIGAATVQADGSFALDWVPEAGDHTIAARYASQRADRADDFAHPLWFGIDDSPSPSSPAASPPSAELAGRPAVRGRTVTVRLRCRSEAGSCRGVVRVRRGGRRVAARRFVIAPRAQKRLRLRLPRALGRSLRRRGRLSVQVVVDLDDAAPVARRVTLRRR